MQVNEVFGMQTNKVLFFLNFLASKTNGYEEPLAALYNRALNENDNIQRLRGMLDDCNFYGEIGGILSREGWDILKKVYSNPTRALEYMPTVRQIYQRIDSEMSTCTKMMESPLPFNTTISVLKKNDEYAYMEALRTIASTCVHLMLVYSGTNSIKNLTWNDGWGIRERIHAVNTKFLPGLCNEIRPNIGWVILKRKLGGHALFGGEAFYLAYEDIINEDAETAFFHKEPIGTHAFLNVDAYESNQLNVPYCWGVGNIVSSTPENAITYLQQDIATGVHNPTWNDVQRKIPTPFECLKKLAGGNRFCISPDELVRIMNQWEMGHEIEMRKQSHKCLFCGNRVVGKKMVCDEHFISEM